MMEYTAGSWIMEPETTEKKSRCSCGCNRQVTLEEFKTHLTGIGRRRSSQQLKDTDPLSAQGIYEQLGELMSSGDLEHAVTLAKALSTLLDATTGGSDDDGDTMTTDTKHASLIHQDARHGKVLRHASKALRDSGRHDLADGLLAVLRAAHLPEEDDPAPAAAPGKTKTTDPTFDELVLARRLAAGGYPQSAA